jgi:hypothetical protein
MISATKFTNPDSVNALRKTFYTIVPPEYLSIGTYTAPDAAATYTCFIALESPSLGRSFASDVSRPDVGITCVRSSSTVPSLPKFIFELGRLLVSPPDAPKDATTKPLETGFVVAAEIGTRQAWLFWDAGNAAAAAAANVDEAEGAGSKAPVANINNGNLPGFDTSACAAVPLGVDINSILPGSVSATDASKPKALPIDAKKFVTLPAVTGQSLTFGGPDAEAWADLRRISSELEVAANFKVKVGSLLGPSQPAA